METTKINITLGSRSYDVNIPDSEFLVYLEYELSELKNKDGSIDIPVFLNHYLKKSYASFKTNKEYDALKSQNTALKEKLDRQENELKNILEELKQG